jgi:hypothetical protein
MGDAEATVFGFGNAVSLFAAGADALGAATGCSGADALASGDAPAGGDDSFAAAGTTTGAAAGGGAEGAFDFAFGSGSFFGAVIMMSATLSFCISANP